MEREKWIYLGEIEGKEQETNEGEKKIIKRKVKNEGQGNVMLGENW